MRGFTASRSEVEWIGLAVDPRIERHVHLRGERRLDIPQDADQKRVELAKNRNQGEKLRRCAAFRNEDYGLLRHADAEVAVRGFGGVQEHAWRSGAGEGRCQFASDVARSAASGHDILVW